MKIQINNLEALERLIGNDNELEFDIRQSVVETFTKRHLRSIVNLELVSKVATELKKEIIKEFLIEIKSGSGKTYRLTDELSATIKTVVANEMVSIIKGTVEKAFSDLVSVDSLKNRINLKISDTEKSIENHALKIKSKVIEQCVRLESEISDRILSGAIDRLVSDRIKQKFNL